MRGNRRHGDLFVDGPNELSLCITISGLARGTTVNKRRLAQGCKSTCAHYNPDNSDHGGLHPNIAIVATLAIRVTKSMPALQYY